MVNTAIVVHRHQVKLLKTSLENHGLYDKSERITNHESIRDAMVIPTLLPFSAELTQASYLQQTLAIDTSLELLEIVPMEQKQSLSVSQHHKLQNIVRQWLEDLPQGLATNIDELCKQVPSSYSLYQPMLLLPPSAFQSDCWQNLLFSDEKPVDLYRVLAHGFGVTHVARNAPIPLESKQAQLDSKISSNVMRSPSNITPLYGNFGPPPPIPSPSRSDFDQALWVSTKQNGIDQVWAPLHTMFSRGNVTEKARILDLARQCKEPYSAVDLYSGIGYFAFSYAKAGATKVLGWEINPWSVEGMRRGAELNRWSIGIVNDTESDWQNSMAKNNITIFQTDNSLGSRIVEKIGLSIPPILHVNCGLLPTSRDSWETAVQVVDKHGGCIHIHENFLIAEIPEKARAVAVEIQSFLDKLNFDGSLPKVMAELGHIECVKTYAPGIMHCVVDIYIHPKS